MNSKYFVPVASKTIDILEAFRSAHEELSLQQVIARTGVAHSTAFRILHTLMQRGYIARTGAKYRLAKYRQKIKIGYGALSDRVGISAAVADSLRAAVADTGMELLVLNNEQSPQLAVENAHRFVAEDIAVALEFQNHWEVSPVIADIFRTARIPTIAIHIPEPGAVYFGPDNYRAGWTAGVALAEYAASRWKGRFDLLVLVDLPQGGPILQSRMTGALAGVGNRLGGFAPDKVVRVAGGEDSGSARAAVIAAVRKHSRARRLLISGSSDEMALGALEAVRDCGLDRTSAIIGHDGTDAVLEVLAGKECPLIGTVGFFPSTYGKQLVDLALRILQREPVPPCVYVPHELRTRDQAINRALSALSTSR
jgi:ribose transport system substrate-binding protein